MAWIEILWSQHVDEVKLSPPVWVAWIEILWSQHVDEVKLVATRMGGVD